MTFYIVPVTDRETIEGKLTNIGDTVTNASLESLKHATSSGMRTVVKDLVIHFDNSLTNENFNLEHGSDVSNILYINENAKLILDVLGITMLVTGVTETLPDKVGLMLSLPYYSSI